MLHCKLNFNIKSIKLMFWHRAAFDHHAEKRRKRGSLFFRKKKVSLLNIDVYLILLLHYLLDVEDLF